MLLDPERATYGRYEPKRADEYPPFPLDVVVDRDGRVAWLRRDYDDERLRAVLDALLGAP